MQSTNLESGANGCGNGKEMKGRLKPHPGQLLKCPRCESLNTKFCYYNNYNLSQPRHFCKNCRRYWTKGGALRNVLVGGGCRKNKRSTKHQCNSNIVISWVLPEIPDKVATTTMALSTNTIVASSTSSFINI